MTTIPIDQLDSSNARWNVRRVWAHNNIALARPSATGFGIAVHEVAHDARLDVYYADGWQRVTPAEETTDD